MSEEKKEYIKVDKAQLDQLLEKVENYDALEMENAELKGDIDLLVKIKNRSDELQQDKLGMMKLKKAYDRKRLPEFLGLDRTKLRKFVLKYNISLPFQI